MLILTTRPQEKPITHPASNKTPWAQETYDEEPSLRLAHLQALQFILFILIDKLSLMQPVLTPFHILLLGNLSMDSIFQIIWVKSIC